MFLFTVVADFLQHQETFAESESDEHSRDYSWNKERFLNHLDATLLLLFVIWGRWITWTTKKHRTRRPPARLPKNCRIVRCAGGERRICLRYKPLHQHCAHQGLGKSCFRLMQRCARVLKDLYWTLVPHPHEVLQSICESCSSDGEDPSACRAWCAYCTAAVAWFRLLLLRERVTKLASPLKDERMKPQHCGRRIPRNYSRRGRMQRRRSRLRRLKRQQRTLRKQLRQRMREDELDQLSNSLWRIIVFDSMLLLEFVSGATPKEWAAAQDLVQLMLFAGCLYCCGMRQTTFHRILHRASYVYGEFLRGSRLVATTVANIWHNQRFNRDDWRQHHAGDTVDTTEPHRREAARQIQIFVNGLHQTHVVDCQADTRVQQLITMLEISTQCASLHWWLSCGSRKLSGTEVLGDLVGCVITLHMRLYGGGPPDTDGDDEEDNDNETWFHGDMSESESEANPQARAAPALQPLSTITVLGQHQSAAQKTRIDVPMRIFELQQQFRLHFQHIAKLDLRRKRTKTSTGHVEGAAERADRLQILEIAVMSVNKLRELKNLMTIDDFNQFLDQDPGYRPHVLAYCALNRVHGEAVREEDVVVVDPNVYKQIKSLQDVATTPDVPDNNTEAKPGTVPKLQAPCAVDHTWPMSRLVSGMVLSLMLEQYSVFRQQRQTLRRACQVFYDASKNPSECASMRERVHADNCRTFNVSIWLMIENDAFIPELHTLDKAFKGKAELFRETANAVLVESVKRTFWRLMLSCTDWTNFLETICSSKVHSVTSSTQQLLLTQLDLSKCTADAKWTTTRLESLAAKRYFPVWIKCMWSADTATRDGVTLSVITAQGWGMEVLELIIQRLWRVEEFNRRMIQEMKTAIFRHEDGIRFVILAEWRRQNPVDRQSLKLGSESCKGQDIKRQGDLVTEHFGESYHQVLIDILIQYFSNEMSTIEQHINRYRMLLRAVPRKHQHSKTFPLPLSIEDAGRIKNGQAFDWRRSDGKWVKAEMTDRATSADQGWIKFRFFGQLANNGTRDEDKFEEVRVSRYRAAHWGRIREIGSVISRGIHREEMRHVLEMGPYAKAVMVNIKIPEWYLYKHRAYLIEGACEGWINAEVMDHDVQSAQVHLRLDSHTYVYDESRAAPTIWMHVDDVNEIAPLGQHETTRSEQRRRAKEKLFREAQRMCGECPAKLTRGPDSDVISTAGFLALEADQNTPYVDLAILGDANPLPQFLLQCTREQQFAVGSERAKKQLFFTFTKTGLITLRLHRKVMKNNPGFGNEPLIFLKFLLAPVSRRERKINYAEHAEAEPKYVLQVHTNSHCREHTWLQRATDNGCDGVALFGEYKDPDLWVTRVQRRSVYRYQVRSERGNETRAQITRCLGTMKCVRKECDQYHIVRKVPFTQPTDGLWKLCPVCKHECQQNHCTNYVFDLRCVGNAVQSSQIQRLLLVAGQHHEDCLNAPFYTATAAATTYLRRKLGWADWTKTPSELRKHTFDLPGSVGFSKAQVFTLSQTDAWFSGDHFQSIMRRERRRHLSALGLKFADLRLFDRTEEEVLAKGPGYNIPPQFTEVVKYVDTSTPIKIIALWHDGIMSRVAREVLRKRCTLYVDPEHIANRIISQPNLVDLIMPLVGMKDATFGILRGEGHKLIDSLVWNNESSGFLAFSFCITNDESRGAYFVSFLLELLQLKKIVGDLRKIAQSLRYVFDLCSKCRIGFNVAWGALLQRRETVEEAYAANKLCALWFELEDQHDELQAYTHCWFETQKIPYSIQPDKIHVSRLFQDLARFVASERKPAFRQAARMLTGLLDLKEGMRELSHFVENWKNEPALKSRIQLLLSPYYIRAVFQWARNTSESDILQYLTYTTSNPIESLHNAEKIATRGGKCSVLGLVETLHGMLLSQAQNNFVGKVHKYGVKRNLMRQSAVKGAREFKSRGAKRSSFAAGRLDRCRQQNLGNTKCRHFMNLHFLCEKPLKGRIVGVWGWRNNVHSADKQKCNVSTRSCMYPGPNNRNAKSALDQGLGWLGKFIAVILHWNDDRNSRMLMSIVQYFQDVFAKSTKQKDRGVSSRTWLRIFNRITELRNRAAIEYKLLELFECETMSEFQTLGIDDVLKDSNWKTFADDNKVHWLGDAVNSCWERVKQFSVVECLATMAERLRDKDYSHSYILHIKTPHLEDWFVLKFTSLADRLTFWWYTAFATKERFKGKKRSVDNPGLFRILHELERNLAISLFWHSGKSDDAVELWVVYEDMLEMWKAFNVHSPAFIALCRRCNSDIFSKAGDDGKGDDFQMSGAWTDIKKNSSLYQTCLYTTTQHVFRRMERIDMAVRDSLYPEGCYDALRRLLTLWKEYKLLNPELFTSSRPLLQTIAVRMTEVKQIINRECSRLLQDVIQRGVSALDLNHATRPELRHERSLSQLTASDEDETHELQIHPDLAIATDQLCDPEQVDVIQSATGHGRFARPISVSTAKAQQSVKRHNATHTDQELLRLVSRTMEEMDLGITRSQLVCVEAEHCEHGDQQYLQCTSCPMKVHLKCADVSFKEFVSATQDGSVWRCFACIGMLQLNLTASMPPRHEAVHHPCGHRETRNQLLMRVNEQLPVLVARRVCPMEYAPEVAFAFYFALWMQPIRDVFVKNNFVHKGSETDAFLVGSMLSKMRDCAFLSRERLTVLHTRISSKTVFGEALNLILSALSEMQPECAETHQRLSWTSVRYHQLNTEKHQIANITILSKAPRWKKNGPNLRNVSGLGNLCMVITDQNICYLLESESDKSVVRIGQDYVATCRKPQDWHAVQDCAFLLYFQDPSRVLQLKDGLKNQAAAGVPRTIPMSLFAGSADSNSNRQRSWLEVKHRRIDQTEYVTSALLYGRRSPTFVGQFDIARNREERNQIIQRLTEQRIRQVSGVLKPSRGDGNCLIRTIAQHEGNSVEGIPMDTPAYHHALDALQRKRDQICDYYEQYVANGTIQAADANEMNTCRRNGSHLSLDFVRAYHLHEQTNVFVLEYEPTFDDLSVSLFYEETWKLAGYRPFCLLRTACSGRYGMYHYDWLQIENPYVSLAGLITEEKRASSAEVSRAVGFQHFRGDNVLPLRPKHPRLHAVDATVWRYILQGHIFDPSEQGEHCRARFRVVQPGVNVVGVVCGATDFSLQREQRVKVTASSNAAVIKAVFGVNPITPELLTRSSEADAKIVCGFVRRNAAGTIPAELLCVILEHFYRRMSDWERAPSSHIIGAKTSPRRLRHRPTHGDEVLLRQHYEASARCSEPLFDGCVMRFYSRRIRGVQIAACNQLTGSLKCQLCPIRIHADCSLTPSSPVCPWCVSTIDNIFADWQSPRMNQCTLRDVIPMDLPALPPPEGSEMMMASDEGSEMTGGCGKRELQRALRECAQRPQKRARFEEDMGEKEAQRHSNEPHDSSPDLQILSNETRPDSVKKSVLGKRRVRDIDVGQASGTTAVRKRPIEITERVKDKIRRSERRTITKRIEAFVESINLRIQRLSSEWITSNDAPPATEKFTFEFQGWDAYLEKLDEIDHYNPKNLTLRKWWGQRRTSVLANSLLPDMLDATDEAAKQLGARVDEAIRTKFYGLARLSLADAALESRFQLKTTQKPVFCGFKFAETRLREKLWFYVEEQDVRERLSVKELQNRTVWSQEIVIRLKQAQCALEAEYSGVSDSLSDDELDMDLEGDESEDENEESEVVHVVDRAVQPAEKASSPTSSLSSLERFSYGQHTICRQPAQDDQCTSTVSSVTPGSATRAVSVTSETNSVRSDLMSTQTLSQRSEDGSEVLQPTYETFCEKNNLSKKHSE